MADTQEQVFVLRLHDRTESPDKTRDEPISLYQVSSGQRRYFGSLTALLEFLSHLDPRQDVPDEPHLRS